MNHQSNRMLSNLWSAVVSLCVLLLLVPALSAYASNIVVQPLATATKDGIIVAVTWLHIDAKRVAIEYTVSGLKNVTGYQLSGCPIQGATLMDGDGRQVGQGEPKSRCIMDENWNVRVTQSFYDNLSALKAEPVSLHFVTTVVNGGEVTLTDDQGNYTNAPSSPLGEFSFDLSAIPEKDLTIQQSLARGNGVTGLLRSVEFNPSFVASEICLTLPDTADWQPEIALISDQGRVKADSLEVLNFKQSKAWTSRNRCYRATFPVTPDMNQTNGFQIEVERLVTSLPEVITEAQCNAARDKLATGISGIAITCHQTGITYNFEVTQKPADMSMEDTYRTATRAFSDVVEGPWTFTVVAQRQSLVWCYEVVLRRDGTLSITGHQPPALKEFPISSGDKLKARCFASWADAANFLSGGKLKLPQDATEKEYEIASETLIVDNSHVISVLFGPTSTSAPVTFADTSMSLNQWQTYRHEWLGVELQYPSEWQPWDETSAFVRFATSNKQPLEEAFAIVQANLPIDTVTDFKTDLPVAMTRTITLDNQPALFLQIAPGEQALGFTSVVFVITPDRQMLTIGNHTVEPALFEKILSTVRFFKSKASYGKPAAMATPVPPTIATATHVAKVSATEQAHAGVDRIVAKIDDWVMKFLTSTPYSDSGVAYDYDAMRIVISAHPKALETMTNYDFQLYKPIPKEYWPPSLIEALKDQDPRIEVQLIPDIIIITDTVQITSTVSP